MYLGGHCEQWHIELEIESYYENFIIVNSMSNL